MKMLPDMEEEETEMEMPEKSGAPKVEVEVEKEVSAAPDMSIPLPEGFPMPPNVRDGETFEVIAKAKVKDGRLMFESFDGQAAAPGEETEADSYEASENALREAMKTEGYR
jgi:hypothetical protein